MAVGVVVTVAVATGCSNGAQPQSAPVQGATVPTAAPTTTTTNPYAVPDQIDAAYVNRVLAGLDAIEGDIFREVRATKNLTPEIVHRVGALYTNLTAAGVLVNVYQVGMALDFSGYVDNPGNAVTTVTEMLTTRSTCVYVRGLRDQKARAQTPSAAHEVWIALRPKPLDTLNPIGWGYQYNGSTVERQAPPTNPCDGF
ncbi:MAG: hypothetical protein AB1673_02365 [Actinomycetota bacterium]